jgi:hypothetical protein
LRPACVLAALAFLAGCEFLFQLDKVPPEVHLLVPQDSAIVSGDVTLEASALDSIGVTRVEFFVDGAFLDSGAHGGANYTATWSASGQAERSSHTIFARALDPANNVGYSETAHVLVGVRDLDILHSSFTLGARGWLAAPFDAAAGDSVLGEFRVLNAAQLADFFWCDAANFALFQQGQQFTAYDRAQNANSVVVARRTDMAGTYYVVFNNTSTSTRQVWARFLLRRR